MEKSERIEKRQTLTAQDGRKLDIIFRPCTFEDAAALIDCIKEEYGDTYFKRHFYETGYLQQRMQDGSIFFMVAETETGEIAGMLILKSFYPKESMCEIASEIFKKEYRGYHMAYPFFCYAMDILKSKKYSAAYCLPVLFHDITQKLLYRLGLRATGFILNVFDLSVISHSYANGRNQKHSQGVQIMAMKKRDAGILYVPEEHRNMIQDIYEKLDVSYQFAKETSQSDGSLMLSWENDSVQSSCEITVLACGEGLDAKVQEIERQYSKNDRQTFNIFLNMNDPNAVWGYGILKKMGYYFTGIKPLCSDKEYMILHNPKQMVVFGEDYVLTEEFRTLWDYIEQHR